MSLLEAEAQTMGAFKQSVEDLALEELQRLDLLRLDLQTQLDGVLNEIKAVKTILRAAGGPASPSKPKPKKKQVPFSMSEERETALIQWLTGNEDEITSKMAVAQFPEWSDSYVNMALKELRETGVLRLAATAGSMNIYRSMI